MVCPISAALRANSELACICLRAASTPEELVVAPFREEELVVEDRPCCLLRRSAMARNSGVRSLRLEAVGSGILPPVVAILEADCAAHTVNCFLLLS